MKVYGISGLGADERVYQELNKFLSTPITPLAWLQPKPKEPFKEYLFRFKEQIDTSEDFILVGVSFGGMVAVELNKYLAPKKTIIISSNATKQELPKAFRAFRYINIIPFLPNRFLKPPAFFAHWLFGIKSKKHKKLLGKIIEDTDVVFLKWAINQIISWKNTDVPANLIRIHGTKDRLLKPNPQAKTMIIEGGGHFMVIENAEKIAVYLNEVISWETIR